MGVCQEFCNALIITLGFSPLLLAPLVPYQTVGYLMMAIMAISALATFFLIPAIVRAKVLQPMLFPGQAGDPAMACRVAPVCQRVFAKEAGSPCRRGRCEWRDPDQLTPDILNPDLLGRRG
ncbi:hypothetical protein G3480_23200 [Thiorhodococcus mannitoliphagus]|uniref:MMPL family transporter n=1 Tax=Thiorhodococcus mannitoliphagus TaxID=329406 RepID=A0A6P1DY87_9GAMM|nr:hypothetical protein [Thiorhodococcus mannitoliphagus]NEX23168.1 hypothetical protein [Thiorhodococcus mannitoliphagus]